MINLLNKFFKNQRTRLRLSSLSGQVAIILILLTAIALIMYAVTLNLGSVAQYKTLTTIASNSSASFAASALASYAESLYQVQLGGEQRADDDLSVCAFAGWVGSLIKIGAFAALIVLIVTTAGTGSFLASLLIPAIIAMVLSGISMALQLVFVQPGLNALWAKQMEGIVSQNDQYVERAILNALQRVVTDPSSVDDLHDMDLDGRTDAQGDKVGRFGFYYSERLKTLTGMNTSVIKEFQDGLRRLMNTIQLPADCNAATLSPTAQLCCRDSGNPNKIIPSFCNPCCVSNEVAKDADGNDIIDNFGRKVWVYRPMWCDSSDNPMAGHFDEQGNPASATKLGTADTCGNLAGNTHDAFSVAGSALITADSPATPYEWVYDLSWLDEARPSILTLLGRDDEIKSFKVNTKGSQSYPPPQVEDDSGATALVNVYRLNDTWPWDLTTNPAMPAPVNVFPFLYKITDWGLNLSDKSRGGDMKATTWDAGDEAKCHWYDKNFATPCPDPYDDDPLTMDTTQNDGNLPLGYPLQLELSIDPSSLTYSGAAWVDGLYENTCQGSACVPDKVSWCAGGICVVGETSGLDMFKSTNDQCAIDPDLSWNTAPNLRSYPWKRGMERFCSSTWPYFAMCPRHGQCVEGSDTVECLCYAKPGVTVVVAPAANANWPDDSLDAFIYGSREFLREAQAWAQEDPKRLAATIKDWYDQAATWIEPPCVDGRLMDGSACTTAFLNNSNNDGSLHRWRDMFKDQRDKLKSWIEAPVLGAANPDIGTGVNECNEVWCVPGRTAGLDQNAVCNEASGGACDQVCPGVKAGSVANPGEAAVDGAFYGDDLDSPPAKILGNPQGVANCLKYNALDFNGPIPYAFTDPQDATAYTLYGNAAKFARCFDSNSGAGACEEADCEVLPRSLINTVAEEFDTNEFVVPHNTTGSAVVSGSTVGDILLFSNCMADCNPDPTGGTGDWRWCQAAFGYGGPTPWQGPAKPVANQYPAFNAPNTPPDWATVKALRDCQNITCPNLYGSCASDRSTCDGTADQCEQDIADCEECMRVCSTPVCAGGPNCIPDCCGTTCTTDPRCAPGYAPPACCTVCDEEACPGCDETSCYDPATSCTNKVTGCVDGSVGANCQNLAAGGNCSGCGGTSSLCSCSCNESECRNAAACGTRDCDDYVMLNCPCIGTYENCLTAKNCEGAKTARDNACADASSIRPGQQPDPDCLKASRDLYRTCLNGCRTQYQNCIDTDLANTNVPSGGDIPCSCGAAYCGGSCANGTVCAAVSGPFCQFQNEVDVAYGDCLQWGAGKAPYEKVWDSWILAQGDCVAQEVAQDSAHRWTFDDELYESTLEAINQGEKFKKRAEYLTDIDNGARYFYAVADYAANEFVRFLDGSDGVFDPAHPDSPVERLIYYRSNVNSLNQILPYHSIYGWQSLPAPGKARGNWHFVRVDVKIPGRCQGQCYKDSTAAQWKAPYEPSLPTVKTYTHAWGTRRCYSLGDSFDKVLNCEKSGDYDRDTLCFQGGVVMANVIRYDEDQDVVLKFANGLNLWKVKSGNPSASTGPLAPLDNLSVDCKSLPGAEGAFILNSTKDDDTWGDNCWNRVSQFLNRGVSTKTCAEYYFHDQTPRGFNLKFVPCPPRLTIDDSDS